MYGVSLGPVSGNLYCFYYSGTPDTTIIRKINSDNSVIWMTGVAMKPIRKNPAIDDKEQHVYFASYTVTLSVWRLLASDGSVVSAQTL